MGSKDFYLMMKDSTVMVINFDNGVYDVLNESLLPFALKGRILQVPVILDGTDRQRWC